MTPHRALNWALAAALALVLAYVGPTLLAGPDDHSTERAQALDLEDAIRAEAAAARFARAASALCGQNAGWTLLEDGAVQCITKRGHKTMTARVAP